MDTFIQFFVSQVKSKPTDSAFWEGLMYVKEDFSLEDLSKSETARTQDSR
jgi:hypothetical protein